MNVYRSTWSYCNRTNNKNKVSCDHVPQPKPRVASATESQFSATTRTLHKAADKVRNLLDSDATRGSETSKSFPRGKNQNHMPNISSIDNPYETYVNSPNVDSSESRDSVPFEISPEPRHRTYVNSPNIDSSESRDTVPFDLSPERSHRTSRRDGCHRRPARQESYDSPDTDQMMKDLMDSVSLTKSLARKPSLQDSGMQSRCSSNSPIKYKYSTSGSPCRCVKQNSGGDHVERDEELSKKKRAYLDALWGYKVAREHARHSAEKKKTMSDIVPMQIPFKSLLSAFDTENSHSDSTKKENKYHSSQASDSCTNMPDSESVPTSKRSTVSEGFKTRKRVLSLGKKRVQPCNDVTESSGDKSLRPVDIHRKKRRLTAQPCVGKRRDNSDTTDYSSLDSTTATSVTTECKHSRSNSGKPKLLARYAGDPVPWNKSTCLRDVSSPQYDSVPWNKSTCLRDVSFPQYDPVPWNKSTCLRDVHSPQYHTRSLGMRHRQKQLMEAEPDIYYDAESSKCQVKKRSSPLAKRKITNLSKPIDSCPLNRKQEHSQHRKQEHLHGNFNKLNIQNKQCCEQDVKCNPKVPVLRSQYQKALQYGLQKTRKKKVPERSEQSTSAAKHDPSHKINRMVTEANTENKQCQVGSPLPKFRCFKKKHEASVKPKVRPGVTRPGVNRSTMTNSSCYCHFSYTNRYIKKKLGKSGNVTCKTKESTKHDIRVDGTTQSISHDEPFDETSQSSNYDIQFDKTSIPNKHNIQLDETSLPSKHAIQLDQASITTYHSIWDDDDDASIPTKHNIQLDQTNIPNNHNIQSEEISLPTSPNIWLDESSLSTNHDTLSDETSLLTNHEIPLDEKSLPTNHNIGLDETSLSTNQDIRSDAPCSPRILELARRFDSNPVIRIRFRTQKTPSPTEMQKPTSADGSQVHPDVKDTMCPQNSPQQHVNLVDIIKQTKSLVQKAVHNIQERRLENYRKSDPDNAECKCSNENSNKRSLDHIV